MRVKMTTLGEVVARTGGTLQTGPFGSQLHASDYSALGTPLVMPVNLGDNEIVEEGISRVGAEHVRRLRRHALRTGDIIFSRRGDVGRRSIVRHQQEGWLCGTGCLAARFGRRLNDVNPAYIALYIGTAVAQGWLQDNAVGGTMPNLNTSILAALPIALPERSHQDRAVSYLEDADAIVTALEEQVAKKNAMKQGMMQQLLTGRTRLPGFGRPWVDQRIAEIASIVKGAQLGRASMDPGQSIPVWNGGIEPSGFTGRPNIERAVVTVSEGGNSCGWVGRPRGAFWLGGHCYALDPKSAGHSVSFLYHRLKLAEPQIMALRVGSGLPNIQKKRLSDFVVSVPTDKSEAAAIADIQDVVDAEIAALHQRLEKARAIKTGMMQELLTGTARLLMETAS